MRPDAVNDHISSKLHTTKMRERQAGSIAGVKLLACIADYKDTVIAESGGQQPAGFALVPEKVQVIRAEFLQQLLRAGIELAKVNKLRPWLAAHGQVASLACSTRTR